MAAGNPRRIGQYEILGELGEGAMGKVYKAVQPSLNRVVAIKVLPSEFLDDAKRVERFNREAQAVALINHANVVQIIDKDEEDDHLYFVMEYVPGMSLDELMQRRRLSLREALIVIKAVSKGLEAAHAKSVVHRDLNPRNILINDDLSTVKVADFGISRVETISRSHGTLSTSEISMGTLHYIAPEQATDMVGADHRADIYSLGVLLYEMLTGRVPVGRFNLPSQLNTEVPSGIDPIVLKCLSADPDERYPSAGALITDLRKLEDRLRLGLAQDLSGISKSTSKILRRSTSTLTIGKKKWVPIAAGVAGVAVIAAIAFAWQSSAGEAPAAASEVAAVDNRARILVQPTEGVSEEALVADLDSLDLPDFEPPVAPVGEDEPGAELPAETTVEPEETEADESSDVVVADAEAVTPAPQTPSLDSDIEVIREKYLAKLYEPALGDIDDLIAKHGSAAGLAEAYLLKGQIQQSQKMLDEALATYVETQTRFPRSASAAEAQYRQARLTVELGGKDRLRQGLKVAKDLVASQGRSAWAPKALLLAADVQEKLKLQVRDSQLNATVPAALESYRQLATSYPRDPGSEKALWALGEIYEDIKKFDLAIESFEKLARTFPKTKYDAWWRSARIYDRKLDDNAKATEAYRKVPSNSPEFADAQKRIAKLSG